MDSERSMDHLRATLYNYLGPCDLHHQVVLQSVHPLESVNVSDESAEGFVYDPFSGVCLPGDVSNKSYEMFAIPLAFDVIIMGLTMFKTYRLAAAVRKESGAVIV